MSYLPDSPVPQADVRSRRGGARVGASPGLRWVPPAAALVVALATSVGVPWPAPAASSTAAPASGAAERAGQVALSPGQLPRGENTKLPVVVGDYIVSGQSRARVRAPNWYLVGASGSGWVVVTSDKNFNDARVVRVNRGGTQRVLVRDIDVDTVSLSSDGRYVLRSEVRTGGEKLRSVVRVHDAASGALVGKQRLAGVREVLDLAGGWAVVSGDGRHPTVWWKVGAAQVRTLDRRAAFFVDLGEGLMGYAKRDPYQGGCSFLATAPLPGQASRPGLDRWR